MRLNLAKLYQFFGIPIKEVKHEFLVRYFVVFIVTFLVWEIMYGTAICWVVLSKCEVQI